MKHPNSKFALKLMLWAICIEVLSVLVCSIIETSVASAASVASLVESIISIACSILFIVAYGIGGKDSKQFKKAFLGEILGICFGVLAIVFAIVYVRNSTMEWSYYVTAVFELGTRLVDIFVFYFVCEACKEICEDAGISKLSNTTYWFYTGAVVASAACSMIKSLASNSEIAAGVVAVIAIVAALVARILELILICKSIHRAK